MKNHPKFMTTVVSLFFLFIIILQPILQAKEPSQKVRVGYFAFSSFHDIDANGVYSGYGYDYLQELAKYTDWEYDYVFATWDECLEMLAKGEIDLLGSAQYTSARSKQYDFAEFESGTSYVILCVGANNTTMAYEDFSKFNQMTVGLLEGNSRNDRLAEYCAKNNFTVNSVIYHDQKELLDALHSGKVDAILTSNLRKSKNERIVARFAPSPFYFMTTKGNKVILDDLNRAQAEIKLSDPYFDARLYEKHYANDPSAIPVFTAEELEFIKNTDAITAVFNPAWAPIEYYDEATGEFSGITAEIFDLISVRSGLKFKFIPTTSFAEALALANTGQIDVICGFSKNHEWANKRDLMLTRPYLSAPIIKVTNTNIKENHKIALPEDYRTSIEVIQSKNPAFDVQYFPTTKECFDALNQGIVSATYANSHVADLLLSDYRYQGLVPATLSNYTDELSIGVSKSANKLLLSILNKTLQTIPDKKINEIIMKKVVKQKELTLLDLIYQNPLTALLLSAALFLSIISVLSYIIFTKNSTNKRIYDLLYKDPLTGIYNLNKFRIEAKKTLHKNPLTQYAIVYTDIEKFRCINDIYGYSEADRVLQSFSHMISHLTDLEEVFARISADNFVMLLKYKDRNSLIERLKNADQNLNTIEKKNGEPYHLILISGIYVLHPQDKSITTAIDKANYARKRIKGSHKSNAAFYDEQVEEELILERELESIMAESLENEEFIPYYQPKYNLQSKSIVGAEALVRWLHPVKGIIPPIKFIPLFEKNGFIINLDFYIYEQVCKTLRNWLDEGRTVVPISVNVSRIHLQKADFIPHLKKIITKYQIPIDLLELEITESAFIENIDSLTNLLHELKANGFILSMDDFGVGYSSLSLLKDLPIDIVKLDKEFLQKNIVSDKERIVIQGFVNIAHNLHLHVVSEGVETQEQAQMLKEIGCEMVQGYLFAKPMPLADFEQELDKTNTNKVSL